MIKWIKRSSNEVVKPCVNDTTKNESILTKITHGLSKTRHRFGSKLLNLLRGQTQIDAAILDELESILISADVGVETSQQLLSAVQKDLMRVKCVDGAQVLQVLKTHLISCLTIPALTLTPTPHPLVILMVGINGAGKTTLIGKLAKRYQQMGKKVILAAGDTFRSAAVEQLSVWGLRHQIPVIAQHTGADSASVIFDAFQAAKARGMDVLIADTAGRLHTQQHLMDELKKIKRVLQKIDPTAPHEVILVLDASIGQNALNQARQFHQDLGITSISMTKLDGTAKGGILFAIAHELGVPFSYLGVGEQADDLQVFDAVQFVDALFIEERVQ